MYCMLYCGCPFNIKATDFKTCVNIPELLVDKRENAKRHKAEMFAVLQFCKSMRQIRNTPFSHYDWAFFEYLKNCLSVEYKWSFI